MVHLHYLPRKRSKPIVISCPHSGLMIPDYCTELLEQPEDVLKTDPDMYVNELYGSAPRIGIPLLVCASHRYVIDVNRSVGSTKSHGLIWKKTSGGVEFQKNITKENKERRIRELYLSYHGFLGMLVSDTVDRFGY